MFSSIKKNRQFDLQSRLGSYSYLKPEGNERIKFARLPKRKIKSVWWTVVIFGVLLYFFFYMSNY